MGFDFFWEGYNGCYLDKLVMYWLAPGNIQQLCDEKSKTCFYVFCAVFFNSFSSERRGRFFSGRKKVTRTQGLENK